MKEENQKCENCTKPLGERVFSLVNRNKKERHFCSAQCRTAGRNEAKK